MSRAAAVLLWLLGTGCGGRVDAAAGVAAEASPEAGATPTEIAVGDAGVTCSIPPAAAGHAGTGVCVMAMSCTGGAAPMTVTIRCFGGGAIVSCFVNGEQASTFTTLAPSAAQDCDCTNLAGFAPLAAQCSP